MSSGTTKSSKTCTLVAGMVSTRYDAGCADLKGVVQRLALRKGGDHELSFSEHIQTHLMCARRYRASCEVSGGPWV
ncbi:hypothetical protein LshimejAT787_1300080 [Lyophyllum shimeji]|uniref:Uncharacterized protein n=1 Tax=Lyophyllum shimeji TaxID=47721 RepID=A0A9P3USC8_LYOSH|nr:hypothetical protein LshimejAT787_1300080 [Lyophyllum shimeji]